MSLDLQPIRTAVARHGRVARVIVADVRGSAPRDAGTSMLVWRDGQEGTIGGGALEWEAAATARRALQNDRGAVDQRPLGPDLGQCCGGSVVLGTEIWDAERLAQAEDAAAAGPVFVRRIAGGLPCPKSLYAASGQSAAHVTRLEAGWLTEPLLPAATPLWIWGAGHVGRAVVDVMAPLPGWQITWADTAADRFPASETPGVTGLWASDLPRLARHAPQDAAHLILTYSHPIDLALCDALLQRGFGFCGLIGSATKWARFSKRLTEMGHSERAVRRITCPIGQRTLGKHPTQIAIGVASQLLAVQLELEGETLPTSKSRQAGV